MRFQGFSFPLRIKISASPWSTMDDGFVWHRSIYSHCLIFWITLHIWKTKILKTESSFCTAKWHWISKFVNNLTRESKCLSCLCVHFTWKLEPDKRMYYTKVLRSKTQLPMIFTSMLGNWTKKKYTRLYCCSNTAPLIRTYEMIQEKRNESVPSSNKNFS